MRSPAFILTRARKRRVPVKTLFRIPTQSLMTVSTVFVKKIMWDLKKNPEY